MLRVIVQAGEHYLRYSSCDATEVEAAGQEDLYCATMAVETLPKWRIQ